MGNKNTVDYRTSLSKLHPLIFLWTPKLFISPVHFSFSSKFFSYLCIYPINHGCRHGHGGHGSSLFLNPYFARDVFLKNLLLCHSSRNQKLFWRRHSQNLVRGHEKNSNYGVEITGRDICEPKNWISSFLPIPPSQTLPQAEGNYPFHPTSISWESIFSPSRKGGGLWSWKMTKLKLVKVLATSFDKFQHLATFTFLISVFLCHNLDSVMLKGEGCLT